MIKSVTVTNYLGESIELELGNPEKSGFLIKSIKGLGPVKSTINIRSGSISDGGTYNSARKDTRNIVLNIVYMWKDTIEEARLLSYKYFPVKRQIKLVIKTDNRLLETYGYVESNEPDIFSKQSGTQISIICPDPYFQSSGPNGNNTTVFSGYEDKFEFPFEDDKDSSPTLEFSLVRNFTEQNIPYDGDAEIGVMIYIHAIGDATNVTIYNTGSRQTMKIDTAKLTGYAIKAGDEITISTIKGDKYIRLVRDGVTTNILNCLDRNTDWITLAKGDNIFTYTAESGESNLQFKIENKVLYEGV